MDYLLILVHILYFDYLVNKLYIKIAPALLVRARWRLKSEIVNQDPLSVCVCRCKSKKRKRIDFFFLAETRAVSDKDR